jgi:hypothetical protein
MRGSANDDAFYRKDICHGHRIAAIDGANPVWSSAVNGISTLIGDDAWCR